MNEILPVPLAAGHDDQVEEAPVEQMRGGVLVEGCGNAANESPAGADVAFWWQGHDPTVARAVDVDDIGTLSRQQSAKRQNRERSRHCRMTKGLNRQSALLRHRHDGTTRLQHQEDAMATLHQTFGMQQDGQLLPPTAMLDSAMRMFTRFLTTTFARVAASPPGRPAPVARPSNIRAPRHGRTPGASRAGSRPHGTTRCPWP